MVGTADKAHAGLFVSVSVAPPPLPVYAQPPIPGPGYIWTPGYWAWNSTAADYYWVPGAWVSAPGAGLLWTPGYWGWANGAYCWNAGYWGPHVGFYGGVSYGFGYTGIGFFGGAWSGGMFTYNSAVTNIGTSVSVTNVYNKTIINNNTTHVSYNGGAGGIKAQPEARELVAAHEHHIGPTNQQLEHQQLASKNPDLKFANNHGRPTVAATAKAGDFSKGHTVGAEASGGAIKSASLKTQGAPVDGHHPGNHAPNSPVAHQMHSDGQNKSAAAPSWVRRASMPNAHPAMRHPVTFRPAKPHAAANAHR